MFNVETSRLYDYDDFSELDKNLIKVSDKKEEGRFLIQPCPRIILTIFAVPVLALVDTGSQITALSESFYKYLCGHGIFSELPVSNVTLFTAIGKKPTTIQKQVSCTVSINEQISNINFLIVPRLSNPIILGNDWLLTNKVLINYDNREIVIKGTRVADRWINFGKSISDESRYDNDKDDITYIQVVNNNIDDIVEPDKIKQGEMCIEKIPEVQERGEISTEINFDSHLFSFCDKTMGDDISTEHYLMSEDPNDKGIFSGVIYENDLYSEG